MKQFLSICILFTMLATLVIDPGSFVVHETLAFPGQADTDDDGIDDSLDMDDDNDGILDSLECPIDLQPVDFAATSTSISTVNGVLNSNGETATITASSTANYRNGDNDLVNIAERSDQVITFTSDKPLTDLEIFVDDILHHINASQSNLIGNFSFILDDGTPLPNNAFTISGTVPAAFTPGATDVVTTFTVGTNQYVGDPTPTGGSNQGFGYITFSNLGRDMIAEHGGIRSFTIEHISNFNQNVTSRIGIQANILEFESSDPDGDGILNCLDLDSDNDGISDLTESGVAAVIAADTNNNGVIDAGETAGYTDGLANVAGAGASIGTSQNLDSDGDGIPDATEARASGDYIPYPAIINDFSDTDDDGILDIYDSDGIATVPGPTTFGSTSAGFKTGTNSPNRDSDDTADTLPDFLDTDTDGDGLLDSVAEESGTITGVSYADPDGNVNNPLTSGVLNNNDDNNNGTDVDVDFRSINAPVDTDGDGVDDFLDIDDDNDGIIDGVENITDVSSEASSDVFEVGENFYQNFDGGTFGFGNGSANQSPSVNPYPGSVSGGVFSNFYSIGKGQYGYASNAVDGRNRFQHDFAIDPVYGITGRFFGADPDGTPPIISDTISGLQEGATYQYSFWAANSEPSGNTNDIQVQINNTEVFLTGPLATDPNAIPWTRYAFTFQGPALATSDFDLVPTRTAPAGNDFYIDNIEIRLLEVDTDGDAIRNHLDLDSDNDGIADIYEAGNLTVAAFDTNGNGTIELSEGFVDNGALSDSAAGNGLDDRIENLLSTAGGGVIPVDSFNTASDGLANFLDLDSDDDGIPDATEARASSNYIAYPATINDAADADDDGILDVYDNNAGTFGSILGGFRSGPRSPNNDGNDTDNLPDYIDTDSDGDGLLDSVAEESGTITGVSYADPDGNVNNPLTSGVLNNNDDNNNGTDVDVDFRSITVPPVVSHGTLAFVNATNEAAYTVSGTCNLAGDAITASATSGGMTPILAVTTCQTGGTYSVNFNVSGFPDGDFTVRSTITDGVNPSVMTTSTATKDTIAPMTTVNVNTLTNGIDDPVLALATIETQSGFDRFEIDYILDNNGTGVSSTLTTLTTTNFNETLNLDPDEAIHTIVVRTYDKAGNFSTITTILPPVINFTAGTQLSNTTINDIVFTVDTPTNQPLTNITLSGTGAAGATLTCVGDNGDTTDPYDDIATCTVTGVTASGPITVNAEDTSNGAVGQAQRSHVIHTTAPVITFTDYVEAGPVQSDEVVISVTDDFPDTTTYQYTFSSDATCDANDTFGTAFTVGDTITFNDESENGNYLCVIATDLAGNTSFQGTSNPLNIDVTVPTIVINEPADITAANETVYPVTGSCTAVGDQITLTIADGTSSVTQNTTCGTGGTYTDTLDISGLVLMALDITADIEDTAGNTAQATAIVDRDNISSTEEAAGPNGGDANNDGMQDSEQANVTTAINPNVGAYTTTEVSGGDCSAITSVSFNVEPDFIRQDADRDYPIGLHGIELACGVVGGTANVTYYWDQEYDTSTWTYRKYLGDAVGTYVDFDSEVTYGTAIVGAQTVTTVSFSITDGGPFDSDGALDGRISDPVGPTIGIPSIPGGGGGGAPKNYPLNLCSTTTNQCLNQYPSPFTSTGSTYQDYQKCVSGGQLGTTCARAWAAANGLTECGSDNECRSTVVPETPSSESNGTEIETPVVTPEVPTEEPVPTEVEIETPTPETEIEAEVEAAVETEEPIELVEEAPVVLEEERPEIDQSICPIFTQHMRRGDRDGSTGQEKQELGVSSLLKEVQLLQQVLFNLGFYGDSIDGVFNQTTHDAVANWQVVHRKEVLEPWGLRNPTGRFYQSSERWMNILLGCDDEVLLDNGVWLD